MARPCMPGLAGRGRPPSCCTGYGEDWWMWAPLAVELVRDHTVIVPDLRGMGLSARPDGGYDKKTQGQDVPWDAYRQGLVNRWELEQLQGPVPQALQGPSRTGGGKRWR